MSNVGTIKYLKSKAPEFIWSVGNDEIVCVARDLLPEKELWLHAGIKLEYHISDVVTDEEKIILDAIAKRMSQKLKKALNDI